MKFKTGDLVQVIKPSPCCNSNRRLGLIFIVQRIKYTSRGLCKCGVSRVAHSVAYTGMLGHTGRPLAIDLHRLKLIPPLDELENTTAKENLKELV